MSRASKEIGYGSFIDANKRKVHTGEVIKKFKFSGELPNLGPAKTEDRSFIEQDLYGWRCSEEEANSFLKNCQRAASDEEYFEYFKSNNPAFPPLDTTMGSEIGVHGDLRDMGALQKIVEHVSGYMGSKYFSHIISRSPDLLQDLHKYIKNDDVGNPRVVPYMIPPEHKHRFIPSSEKMIEDPSDSNLLYLAPERYLRHGKQFIVDINEHDTDIILLSPTTLRYMKVLGDLISEFQNLDDMTIVEIGGGYGGQSFIISQKFKFKKYYNIDLKDPGLLAQKYCDHMGVENFKSITPDELDKLESEEIDLVISNYAFSECNYPTQDIYIDKILSKAKRGYITHNNRAESKKRTAEKLKKQKNFRVMNTDYPPYLHEKNPDKKHPIFTWGKIDEK